MRGRCDHLRFDNDSLQHGFGLVDLYDQGQQKLVVGGIGR
jgi:hypothetical protein